MLGKNLENFSGKKTVLVKGNYLGEVVFKKLRKKMKRKSGFTLVEMLIVVVIIGILSAALIPRLTGYMARTRDLKRHADLRNIAAAITMYKNDYGEFPFYSGGKVLGCEASLNFFRKVSDLAPLLEDYLSSIPFDPQKSNYIDICTEQDNHRPACKRILKKGNYLYTLQKERPEFYPLDQGKTIGVLVAKVETPDFANFVLVSHDSKDYSCVGCPLSFALGNCINVGIFPGRVGEKLNLCDRVEKGSRAEWKEENGQMVCTYASADQLYYLLKIE